MVARMSHLVQSVELGRQTSWWSSVVRWGGIGFILVGLWVMFSPRSADPAWGGFLIVVGLIARRLAPPASLVLFAVALGWGAALNILFGRWPTAAGLVGALVIALAASHAAYRATPRPASAVALSWASLLMAATGTLTLILAFGGSLVAFMTGWSFDARLADVLAVLGVHQAVLAVGLAIGSFLYTRRARWVVLLGGVAGLSAIVSYLSLLLLAQG
jgi:hypothetical protein